MALLAVLGVVAAGVWGAVALAASGVPAPSLSENPTASPTNQTGITFTFSDSQSGVTFQCSLDGAAFAACVSPKAYSSLAQGSHSFQVRAVDSKGKTSDPASYSWVIDTTPPTVLSINRADANPTKANPLHWTVTFSEPVKNVTSGNFGLVTANLGGTAPSISGVAPSGSAPTATWTVTVATAGTTGANNGSIQLNLTAKGSTQDTAGNGLGGSVPVTGQAYTFDTTAPVAPSITSTPANPSNQSTASFSFSDTETGVSFLCKLDGGSYAACASPKSYSGLSDGSHTFSVEAVDGAGNVSPPASYGWTVDTTPPPPPSITGHPANPTNQTSASFTFTDSESSASFLCKLDAGSYVSCFSGQSYGGLAAGSHTFSVEAKDFAGNVSSPTGYSWVVDLTPPPAPSITAKPANPTNQTSASFSFSDSESGVSFLCKLDGATSFTACSSPQSYSGLSEATHTFSVEARDAAGNVSSATSYSWRIDVSPPVITVTFPANGGTYNAASWNAGCSGGPGLCGSATDPSGVSGAAVSIQQQSTGKWWNGSSFSNSSETFYAITQVSGSGTTFSGRYPLAVPPAGSYLVHVRASDGLGNTSTAANQTSLTFTISGAGPPAPTITGHPNNPTTSDSATFSFTDSQAGVSFQCKLDTGAYAACTSPTTYTGLAAGGTSHTFSVEAKDSGDNLSSPTSFTWTINNGAPFTIHGSVTGLVPGVAKSVPLTVDNPNDTPIYITQLTLTVTAGAGSGTCLASSYSVTPWNSSPPSVPDLQVPANATSYPVPVADQPTIKLVDSMTSNQDNCKGKTFTVTFSGQAHS